MTAVSQVNQRGQSVSRVQSGIPDQLDTKKLPSGHATFGATGANAGAKSAVYIYMGHPYDMTGKRLPADSNWLKQNGYVYNEYVARVLLDQQRLVKDAMPAKICAQCSVAMLPDSRFCPQCGTPQVKLYVPNTGDDEGERLRNLIDADDPFSSLAIQSIPAAPPRKTPDQIFAEFKVVEEQRTRAELGRGGGGLGGNEVGSSVGISSAANTYGTIQIGT
jgi:hypothetical protein